MARGDFLLFNAFALDLADGVHNLETGVLKLALIDNVITPTQADATPQWGAGSGIDYDGHQVAEFVGGYSDGGVTISGPETNQAGAVTTLDDDDSNIQLTQNAAGFDDAYWGILYNDSATNKECIGYLDLGGPVSQVAGPININWNASGILTITRS